MGTRARAVLGASALVVLAATIVAGAVVLQGRSPEPTAALGDMGGEDPPDGALATAPGEGASAEAPTTVDGEETTTGPGSPTGASAETPAEPIDTAPPDADEDTTSPPTTQERILPPGPPSSERTLTHVTTIHGAISPKSVVASNTGLYFAQNMMYLHTVTVYDRDHQLLATIPDTVNVTEFGYDGPDADLRGAPVEMAFSPDAAHAYVSNYKMYGPGYGNGGTDVCSPADGYDDSFLYRIDVASLQIDRVIPVGAVPKYVATTPDGRFVLVSNWCSYDVSVIDVEAARELGRIPLGRYPRGIAVTADAATAYVAMMGTYDVAVLDLTSVDTADHLDPTAPGSETERGWPHAEPPPELADVHVDTLTGVGNAPRHLVLDPDERYLYATLNGEGVVVRIDLTTGEALRAATGTAPRSMDISADGEALYVVNYRSNTVSKVRTDDMSVMQTVEVDDRPIGITYDRATADVWVAHYSGSIRVLADR